MTEIPEGAFALTPSGAFLRRFGPGGKSASYSHQKICLVATDPAQLAALLYALSLREEVHYVKYDVRPRAGMWRGRCFARSDEAAGALWRELRSNRDVLVSIQDDRFVARFRESR